MILKIKYEHSKFSPGDSSKSLIIFCGAFRLCIYVTTFDRRWRGRLIQEIPLTSLHIQINVNDRFVRNVDIARGNSDLQIM